MKTVALYTRVSTLHQAEEGYSVGEQEERLRLFAQAHRWLVVGVYSDPGYSGGKLERPAIQRLIKDTKAHLFDSVIVYKLDRLSRSQKDTLYLIEDVFNANGVGLISMQENFDTNTSFGKAMIGILSVFAQLERGQITERMTMGRIGRAKAGYFSGGSKAPIGYTYSKADGSDKHTLQIDEYEAMQVRTVFSLFLHENLTFTEIARRMHEKYTTKYGDWSSTGTIGRILRDRVYIGEVSFSGKWYPGVHDPIIDRATFDAVQVKYDRYMETTAGTHSQNFSGGHLLTGLLRCGICGGRMFVKSWQHRLKSGELRRYEKYACYTQSGHSRKMAASTPCNNVKIPIAELDQKVTAEIQKLAADPSLINVGSVNKDLDKEEDKRAGIQARLESLSKQEEKLIDLYQVGAIDIEAVRKRAEAIKAEREKLSRELDAKDEKRPPAVSADEAIKKLDSFESVFRDGSMKEKHDLVCSLIDEIVVYPDHLEIHWAFSAK